MIPNQMWGETVAFSIENIQLCDSREGDRPIKAIEMLQTCLQNFTHRAYLVGGFYRMVIRVLNTMPFKAVQRESSAS